MPFHEASRLGQSFHCRSFRTSVSPHAIERLPFIHVRAELRISDDASEISDDAVAVSGSTRAMPPDCLYLPDGKTASIRLPQMALEPTGYTP